MTWKFGMALLSRAGIFAKTSSFVEVIWKLALPPLSQTEIFTKIKQFCWCDLKIWHGPIITSWNFRKNEVVLLTWFENLNCPYYHELKCSYWKLELHLLSEARIFLKSKAVLLKWFENLKLLEYFNCSHTARENFKFQISKIRLFVNVTWKFELSLLLRAKVFVKIRQFSWSHFKNWIASIITS